MDAMLHALGICADTHAHLDLLDIVFGGALAGGTSITMRYYWNILKFYVTNKFNKKD